MFCHNLPMACSLFTMVAARAEAAVSPAAALSAAASHVAGLFCSFRRWTDANCSQGIERLIGAQDLYVSGGLDARDETPHRSATWSGCRAEGRSSSHVAAYRLRLDANPVRRRPGGQASAPASGSQSLRQLSKDGWGISALQRASAHATKAGVGAITSPVSVNPA